MRDQPQGKGRRKILSQPIQAAVGLDKHSHFSSRHLEGVSLRQWRCGGARATELCFHHPRRLFWRPLGIVAMTAYSDVPPVACSWALTLLCPSENKDETRINDSHLRLEPRRQRGFCRDYPHGVELHGPGVHSLLVVRLALRNVAAVKVLLRSKMNRLDQALRSATCGVVSLPRSCLPMAHDATRGPLARRAYITACDGGRQSFLCSYVSNPPALLAPTSQPASSFGRGRKFQYAVRYALSSSPSL